MTLLLYQFLLQSLVINNPGSSGRRNVNLSRTRMNCYFTDRPRYVNALPHSVLLLGRCITKKLNWEEFANDSLQKTDYVLNIL